MCIYSIRKILETIRNIVIVMSKNHLLINLKAD